MSERFYRQQGGFKSKAQRRGYAGVTSLRKKLRKMPAFITEGVREEVLKLAKEVQVDAIGLAMMEGIRDRGEMIESISYKIGGRRKTGDYGLTAVIGPGADKGAWQGVAFDTGSARFQKLSINQKNARWQFVKGYWAEFGTAARADSYTYTTAEGVRVNVERDHPGKEARPFMNVAWEANYPKYQKRIKVKIDRALEIAAEFY